MKGYKGFNKDLKCLDFQYEIGKEFETDNAVLCEKGFHFCENPHDVFAYYGAGDNNRFCYIEAEDVSDEKKEDSKRACKKIKIKDEISVFHICKIAVSTFFENFGFKEKIEKSDCNNAGNYGAANAGNCGAANAGDCGAANAGDFGAANAGDYGAANAGDFGAANVLNNGKVKGGYGCVLVARNIEYVDGKLEVTDWACSIVDGVNIKADTWYKLKDGKLIECDEE